MVAREDWGWVKRHPQPRGDPARLGERLVAIAVARLRDGRGTKAITPFAVAGSTTITLRSSVASVAGKEQHAVTGRPTPEAAFCGARRDCSSGEAKQEEWFGREYHAEVTDPCSPAAQDPGVDRERDWSLRGHIGPLFTEAGETSADLQEST
jgi:hypothetical protein